MKQMIRIVIGLSVAWLLTALAPQAGAADQWYDTATNSGLTAGTGTWDTSVAAWASSASPGTNAPGNWVNDNNAWFSASGNSTVTVNNVSAGWLNFTVTGATNTFIGSGPLTLKGGITNTATTTQTFNNPISLANNQAWYLGSGSILVNGQLSGAGVLTKAGTGALTLTNAANSFGGGLIVNNGSVSAPAQSSGTVLGSGPLTLGTVVPTDGSVFSIVTLTLTNAAGVGNYTNTIGDLTSSGGAAVLALNSAANTTNTLIAGNLTRTVPGTLVLSPQNSLAVRENVQVTGNAGLVNGIVPPWFVNSLGGGNYVTTNAAGALTNATYSASFNSSLPNQVVGLTNATSLSPAQTSYAVRVGANLNLSGNTLTVGDGALGGLIFTNNAAITNGALDFGAAEALLYVGSGNTGRIATAMAGSGSLTKFGAGILTVSNTTPWQGGPVNLNGGTLALWATADRTATNWLGGPGAFTKDGPNTLTLAGTNVAPSGLTVNGGGTLNISTNAGTPVLISGGTTLGGNGTSNNKMMVDSANWNLYNNSIIVGNTAATGNVLTVNGGILANVAGLAIGVTAVGANGNSMVISNGATLLIPINGGIYLGNVTGANSNYFYLGGPGARSFVSNCTSTTSASPSGYIVVGGNSANNAGGAWNTLIISNATLISGGGSAGNFIIGGGGAANNNSVQVLAGGIWTNISELSNAGYVVGVNGSGNSLLVNAGAIVVGSVPGGVGAGLGLGSGANNSMTVSNGGSFLKSGSDTFVIGGNTLPSGIANFGGGGNSLYAGGGGALSTLTFGPVTVGSFCANNTVTISNATVTLSGALTVGGNGGAYTGNVNSVYVNGTNATLNMGGNAIAIGNVTSGMATGNVLVVNGGTVTGAGVVSVGSGANTSGNSLTITNGGVLEAKTLTVNTGSGNNIITNSGGVYQFTTATPAITNNAAAGSIALNNGVISFRGVNGVNVKGNWPGGGSQLTNMTFYGANAFRLNNSTNLANTATNQTYWFDSGAGFGATNYAGLEMISDVVGGGTAYTNGSVTIGTNGWLTYSNTTAIMWGAVTNYGKMRFYNSSVTFKTNLVLAEGSTLIWTSNSLITVNGTLTLPTSMTFSNASSSTPSDDWLVLTNAIGAINGSPAAWTGLPKYQRVSKNGNTLRLIPRLPGSLFYVE